MSSFWGLRIRMGRLKRRCGTSYYSSNPHSSHFLFGHYLFKTNFYKQIPKIHTWTLFDSSRKKTLHLKVFFFFFSENLTIFKNNWSEKVKYWLLYYDDSVSIGTGLKIQQSDTKTCGYGNSGFLLHSSQHGNILEINIVKLQLKKASSENLCWLIPWNKSLKIDGKV